MLHVIGVIILTYAVIVTLLSILGEVLNFLTTLLTKEGHQRIKEYWKENLTVTKSDRTLIMGIVVFLVICYIAGLIWS